MNRCYKEAWIRFAIYMVMAGWFLNPGITLGFAIVNFGIAHSCVKKSYKPPVKLEECTTSKQEKEFCISQVKDGSEDGNEQAWVRLYELDPELAHEYYKKTRSYEIFDCGMTDLKNDPKYSEDMSNKSKINLAAERFQRGYSDKALPLSIKVAELLHKQAQDAYWKANSLQNRYEEDGEIYHKQWLLKEKECAELYIKWIKAQYYPLEFDKTEGEAEYAYAYWQESLRRANEQLKLLEEAKA